jgi:hypothetical protein
MDSTLLDGRHRVYQQQLCRYYHIVKRLPRDEAFAKVKDWCNRCLALPGPSPLDNLERDIYYHLDWAMKKTRSGKPYLPLSEENFNQKYPDICTSSVD